MRRTAELSEELEWFLAIALAELRPMCDEVCPIHGLRCDLVGHSPANSWTAHAHPDGKSAYSLWIWDKKRGEAKRTILTKKGDINKQRLLSTKN